MALKPAGLYAGMAIYNNHYFGRWGGGTSEYEAPPLCKCFLFALEIKGLKL